MTFHDIFSGNWAPISTTRGWKPRLDFQQNPPVEIGAQFEPRTGGIPIFCLQVWTPTPQIQTRKSKIQTGRVDFGVWISDFGFRILDLGFWILDFGFWISDFGSWILGCRSIRSFCGSPKRGRLDFRFWISDLGFWNLDFGTRFGVCKRLLLLHADSGRRINQNNPNKNTFVGEDNLIALICFRWMAQPSNEFFDLFHR